MREEFTFPTTFSALGDTDIDIVWIQTQLAGLAVVVGLSGIG